MKKYNFWQLKQIKEERMKKLYERFGLPTTPGIYCFIREVLDGEKDSKGNVKTWKQEVYIGQAKNIRERCASHYMPFSHDHLAISLSKHNNWRVENLYIDETASLDHNERIIIQDFSVTPWVKLFNNSSGGQGSERGKHLENSDYKKKVEEKRMSVEARANKKLENYKKEALSWKKYFDIELIPLHFNITIRPKPNAYLKGKMILSQNTGKAWNNLLDYLGVSSPFKAIEEVENA